MFRHLDLAAASEGMRLEPSAAAAFSGPGALLSTDAGRAYLRRAELSGRMADAVHVVWTTGGRLLPADEFDKFRRRGRAAAEVDDPRSQGADR